MLWVMLWVAQEIRLSGQVQSLCIVTTENRSDLIQNIWTVKRLSQSDIYKLYVFIWGWFFHSLDGVGDRIRTKVHLDIIGKFCTAEVRPKNILHFNVSYSSPPPPPTPCYLVSGLHIGLLCVTISHAVLICPLIRYWKSPENSNQFHLATGTMESPLLEAFYHTRLSTLNVQE